MIKKLIYISLILMIPAKVGAEHLAARDAGNLTVGTLPNARLDPSSVTLRGNGAFPSADIDASSITKQGNTFNAANKLLKLDANSNLSTDLTISGHFNVVTGSVSVPDGQLSVGVPDAADTMNRAMLNISSASSADGSSMGVAKFLSFTNLGAGNGAGGNKIMITGPSETGAASGNLALDISAYLANGNPTTRMLYMQQTNGFVGIGTIKPSSKLDIFGGSQTIRGSNAGLAITGTAGSVSELLTISTGTKRLFVVTSTGIMAGVDLTRQGVAYNNPDYVFENEWQSKMLSIDEAEAFTESNKHLPGMKSTEQVNREGVQAFGQIQALQEKLEEAYLYIFQMNARLRKLEDLLSK